MTLLVDAAQARQTAMLKPLVEHTLLDIERKVRRIEPVFPLTIVDVKARSQRYIDFLIPGLLALTIMQISVAGSGYNIVEYRRKGILKRLFVTPIRPTRFHHRHRARPARHHGHSGGLPVGRRRRSAQGARRRQRARLSVLIFVGSAIFLSLGFCMGSIAKTQQAIMLLGNLITLPQIFLSGVFFSVDSMPGSYSRSRGCCR